MHYNDYLELDTLLSLQHPRVPAQPSRVHAAEHFFIVVHQSCELWLAQILLDLDHATEALSAPEVAGELALEHLSRVADIFGVLHEQIVLLDRLSSHCFARFRPYLGTGSGAQSAQCRELDRKLGLGPTASPVAAAFVSATTAAGLELVEVCRKDLSAGVLHLIVNTLLDIGQGYWRWKVAHLSLVSRLLGDIAGTGGTSSVGYLTQRVRMPFPEVHDARRQAHLTE
ncbi:MAG: tryptophan 2,3-dioxygenase family protein [Pseudonocardiaceae bacterium]